MCIFHIKTYVLLQQYNCIETTDTNNPTVPKPGSTKSIEPSTSHSPKNDITSEATNKPTVPKTPVTEPKDKDNQPSTQDPNVESKADFTNFTVFHWTILLSYWILRQFL